MFDLVAFVKIVGYAGLFGVVFAESGLLIGFFFPGDSLLFTAGFLASQDYFDIRLLAPLLFVAAVTGDSVGYTFGKRVGPRIFKREDSLIFHRKHLESASHYYEKHGGKTIILARFLPVVRTFAPILAGVGKMRYRTFLVYNVIGGFIWSFGMTLLGYFMGKKIPNADRYIVSIVIVIIILSVLPTIIRLMRDRESRAQINVLWKRAVAKIREALKNSHS